MRDWESAELFDPEAERAVLAAAMFDSTQVDVISEIIGTADFHDPDLGRLWDGLEAINAAGFPTDDTTVIIPELKTLGVPEQVRSIAFLHKMLSEGRAQAAHSRFYSKRIRKLAQLRRQREILYQALDRTIANEADPDNNADWLDARMSDTTIGEASVVRSASEVAAEVIADLRKPERIDSKPIYTGIWSIDQYLGGWHAGELVILAARPGNGKTAFAAQVGMHNACKQNQTLFVSLEMKDRELLTRFLCGQAGVDSRLIRNNEITGEQIDSMAEVADTLDGVPFHIFDKPRASLARIRGIAKRRKAETGLSLVVVDYVERVSPPDRRADRRQQIGEITVALRTLARELECVVLLLAQLRREADKSEPNLGMLKESGDLEQEADAVFFLHRNGQDNGGRRPVKCIVPKNRHGQEGVVELNFITHLTMFTDPQVSDAANYTDFGEYNGEEAASKF